MVIGIRAIVPVDTRIVLVVLAIVIVEVIAVHTVEVNVDVDHIVSIGSKVLPVIIVMIVVIVTRVDQ